MDNINETENVTLDASAKDVFVEKNVRVFATPIGEIIGQLATNDDQMIVMRHPRKLVVKVGQTEGQVLIEFQPVINFPSVDEYEVGNMNIFSYVPDEKLIKSFRSAISGIELVEKSLIVPA